VRIMTVSIKPDGRVLVPASLRHEFGASPGEPLVARVEDGRLILERRADVLRRAQRRFAKLEPTDSLVEELLADRRAEAARER
jgi:bifunctional DNA-binding transcriptional regulator/antitoxin component of YhaV-PrlF toxin-antitoxin module